MRRRPELDPGRVGRLGKRRVGPVLVDLLPRREPEVRRGREAGIPGVRDPVDERPSSGGTGATGASGRSSGK